MYDLAKKARAGMKSKAERLAGGKDRKTDSSNWSPAPELNADVKTGMRPVSRRAYKDGGKVADCAPMKRADRKPRKAGGKVEQKGEQPLVDRYINRDLKKANDYRDGKKHIGGLKTGGRAGKLSGGALKRYTEKANEDQDWRYGMLGTLGSDLEGHMFDAKQKWKMKKREKGVDLAEEKLERKGWKRDPDSGHYEPPKDKDDKDGKAHGGRAKKANGGSMTMEEMIEKNPAPVKKPLGLDKIPLPPRRPANLTPAATNKIKPDESKRMKGDYISPQEIGMKKGGRIKKADGGSTKKSAWNMSAAEMLESSRKRQEDVDKSAQESKKKYPGMSAIERAEQSIKGKFTPAYFANLKKEKEKEKDRDEGYKEFADRRAKRDDDADEKRYGGRAKKQDGGPMMMDPRLGIVKPKALEFAQNVVTPGLKNGGRTGKAKGGSFWGSKEFQNAFREARKAYLAGEGPKNFEFKGKSYNTDLMKIPTPPERPRAVQEKVIDVQFGPPKGQMPKTDQMGNPNPGMKKGGRIGKANGGSFGSSVPSAGAGRAPRPLAQSMPGRSGMPASAMANAQGRPFQAGGKFAPVAPPPRMAAMPIQPRTGGDYPAISTQPIQPRTGGDYPAISTMPAPLPQRTPPMMTTMPIDAIPRKSGGRVAKQIGGALGMSADALAQQQQLPQGSPMQGGTFAPQGMAARPSLPMMPNQAAASPSTLMQPTVNAIGRKSGGRTNAKGKTNINIIITAGSKKEPESMVPTPPPAPMGVPPMPAPEAPASPETPPMPPPAAMMGGAPMGGGSPMMGGDMMPPPVPRRAGGRVSKVAHSFKDMTAGSGSGEGRLQKTDIAKRSAHKAGGKVYRSYKDMDAGAGSGKGRMEKTEIQSRKK